MVQVFSSESLNGLEETINNWLKDKHIDLINIDHSAFPIGLQVYYSAILLYNPLSHY